MHVLFIHRNYIYCTYVYSYILALLKTNEGSQYKYRAACGMPQLSDYTYVYTKCYSN